MCLRMRGRNIKFDDKPPAPPPPKKNVNFSKTEKHLR